MSVRCPLTEKNGKRLPFSLILIELSADIVIKRMPDTELESFGQPTEVASVYLCKAGISRYAGN